MRVEGLSLLLLFAVSGAVAAEEAVASGDEPPDMELLEFLGGFETPEGEWFDPLVLVEQAEGRAKPEVTDDD